jgi:hypothetical protein
VQSLRAPRAQISLDSLVVIVIALVLFLSYLLDWSHLVPYSSKVGLIVRLKDIAQLINTSYYQYIQHEYHCLHNSLVCYSFFIPENIHMLLVNGTRGQYILFFGTGPLEQLLEIPGNFTMLEEDNVSKYCYYSNDTQTVTYVYRTKFCFASYPNGTMEVVPAYYCFCKYPGVSGTGGQQYFRLPSTFSGIYGILWNSVAYNGFKDVRHMVIIGKFKINESCEANALADLLWRYQHGQPFACKNLVDTPFFSECLGIYIIDRCAIPSNQLSIVMIPLGLRFDDLFPSFDGNSIDYNATKYQPVPNIYINASSYFTLPRVRNCTIKFSVSNGVIGCKYIDCEYYAEFYNLTKSDTGKTVVKKVNITFMVRYYPSSNNYTIRITSGDPVWKNYIHLINQS